MHDARVFSNFKLNTMFRKTVVPNCSKIVVEVKLLVTICILGGTAYPLLAHNNERVCQWWRKWRRAVFWVLTFISYNGYRMCV